MTPKVSASVGIAGFYEAHIYCPKVMDVQKNNLVAKDANPIQKHAQFF